MSKFVNVGASYIRSLS